MEEMQAVVPAHRPPRGLGDWAAWKIVRFARFWMDKATGMDRAQKVDRKNPTTAVVAEKPLTEAQWVRISQPASQLASQAPFDLTSSSSSSSSLLNAD
jgi:hypothetical protein